jgi:hypothetical protein
MAGGKVTAEKRKEKIEKRGFRTNGGKFSGPVLGLVSSTAEVIPRIC